MARSANTNYTGGTVNFEKATATNDPFLKEDVQKLAEALDTHDHQAGLGLGVRRVQTSVAPSADGQVRVNTNNYQWYGSGVAAVVTAVDDTNAQTIAGLKTFSALSAFSTGVNVGTSTWGTGTWKVLVGSSDVGAASGGLLFQNKAAEAASVGSDLTWAGATNWIATIRGSFINGSGDGKLTFHTASVGALAERMRIDQKGNLGLGVTPSAWGTNSVAAQVGPYTTLWNNEVNAIGSVWSYNSYHDNSNYKSITTAGAVRAKLSTNTFTVGIAPSVTAGSAQTFVDYFQIGSAGNVSVGGAAPSAGIVLSTFHTTPITTGATQYAAYLATTVSSSATVAYGAYVVSNTVAASFTVNNYYGLYIDKPSKGAGSAIGIVYGIYMAVQNSGTTQNMGLYLEAPTGGSQYNNTIHLNGVPAGGSITNDVIYHGNTGAKLTGAGTWTSVSNEFLKNGDRWKTRIDAATELFTGMLWPKSTILDALAAIEVNWYELVSKELDPRDRFLRLGAFAERLHAISPSLSSDGHGVDGVTLASFAIAALQVVHSTASERLATIEAVLAANKITL